MPKAKMVGNMIDMKKYARNTHTVDAQPRRNMTQAQSRTFTAP